MKSGLTFFRVCIELGFWDAASLGDKNEVAFKNCPAKKTTNGSDWRSHNRRRLCVNHKQSSGDENTGTFHIVIKGGTKVQNQGKVHYTN